MFPKKGNKLHSRRQEAEPGVDFNSAIAAALRRELGSTHQAAKTLMRWTGASERAAKYWLSGAHGPGGDQLVRILRNSDEVLRTLLTLAGREGAIMGADAARIRKHLDAAIACLEPRE